MAAIAENLQLVRARIARFPRVKLLAVSKGQDVERLRAAHDAGQNAFGENYVQEAVQKMQLLPKLEWHLIGPLQSNKTRIAAERFDWVQTVASEKVARRLSEQRPAELARWLAQYHRLAPDELQPYLYTLPREQAVRHAFRVAASLESLVIGEPQILGQVKDAYHAAVECGAAGPILGRLFQHAFATAKPMAEWVQALAR